jgi:hypothetical protein
MWWNRVVRKRPARNVAESPLVEPIDGQMVEGLEVKVKS